MRANEFITEADMSARERFLDRVVGPESGGKSWIQNKRSGATGLFQFMPDTWAGVVKKAKPGDPHYGMSFDQMRNSPEAQRAAANQISREYEATIKRNNMPDTPTSYYLLHGHGPKGVAIFNNPDKQLKDIYPEYVRDKNGQMVKSIVYRQNPNFDPNQKLSDFVATRAAKMGDKMTDLYPGRNTQVATNQTTTTPPQDNTLKKQITNVGTNVIGGLVGATNAQAGALPPEKKAALQSPPNKSVPPVTPTAQSQGVVGAELAKTSGGQFTSKADRLNQEKVNAALGVDSATGKQYKAGSKEANLALQQKFRQQPSPSVTSTNSAPSSNDQADLANKYGADSYVAQAAASTSEPNLEKQNSNANQSVTKEDEDEKALNIIKKLSKTR
jgi:hypothetical protein